MKLLTAAIACALVSTALADNNKKEPSPFDTPRAAPKPAMAPKPVGYSGLGIESVTPEDIAKFAAPPLDPKVSRRIQTMLDVRGVLDLRGAIVVRGVSMGGALTSNGGKMFFNWRVTGTTQVWRQDGAMKLPVQLTGGEDNTFIAGIAPDDSYVVVARDIGGQENPGIYLLDPNGGPLKLIQHTPKVQTSVAFISADSKTIYFKANDIKADSYAFYRYDLKTAKRELVFDTPGLWSLADERGDKWLMVKNIGSAQQEVYEYDLKAKQLTPLLGQNEVEQYSVQYGAKPGQVLVQTNKPSEFERLYSFEAGKLTPISPEVKYDLQSFTIDEARKRIYYTINEQGYSRLHAVDAKTLKPVALPKLPAADHVNVAGITRNGRHAQFSVSGAQMPSTVVVFDWQTKKTTTWRVPEAPEVDVSKFAASTIETYPARDGTKIPMVVRRPTICAIDPCPVIVSFHGGPEGQSRPGFSTGAQLYVDAGFVYVEPNVRGSTGYGKQWFHADDGAKRLAIITDIEDAAKHIRTAWAKNGVAPKIGVVGGSYGGYSTLMAMSYFAGSFDAGVAQYSISSFNTFLMNTAPYRRQLRISEYGDPVKDKEALDKLSPMTHVAKIKAPLLLVQGVNDPRTPVGEAMVIHRELEKRKIPTGLILFADEGHGASKRSNIVMQSGHTISFFEKHLLGKWRAVAITLLVATAGTAYAAPWSFELPAGYTEQPAAADAHIASAKALKYAESVDAKVYGLGDVELARITVRFKPGVAVTGDTINTIEHEIVTVSAKAATKHVSDDIVLDGNLVIAETFDEIDKLRLYQRRMYAADTKGAVHLLWLVCKGPAMQIATCEQAQRTMGLVLPDQADLVAPASLSAPAQAPTRQLGSPSVPWSFVLPDGYIEVPGAADEFFTQMRRQKDTQSVEGSVYVSPDENVALVHAHFVIKPERRPTRTSLRVHDLQFTKGAAEKAVKHISDSRSFQGNQLIAEQVGEDAEKRIEQRRIYAVDATGAMHLFLVMCAGPNEHLGACRAAQGTMRLSLSNELALAAESNRRQVRRLSPRLRARAASSPSRRGLAGCTRLQAAVRQVAAATS